MCSRLQAKGTSAFKPLALGAKYSLQIYSELYYYNLEFSAPPVINFRPYLIRIEHAKHVRVPPMPFRFADYGACLLLTRLLSSVSSSHWLVSFSPKLLKALHTITN